MKTIVLRNPHLLRLVDRALIGALMLLAMLLVGVQLARAAEIIP